MLWRSIILCLVGAACAFAANANPALKGTDRCEMQMPVSLRLSLRLLSRSVVSSSHPREWSPGAPLGMGSAGQAGQRFGRLQ